MHNFLTCLICICLLGCVETNKSDIETFDQYRAQVIEPRDSLYVLYTVKEWGKANWWTWEDYSRMYNITNDVVEYYIGGTFYSPDRKKIMVWVGDKLPNATTIENYNPKPELNKVCPVGPDTIHSMSAIIGYRDSINQPWKLYPFNQQSAVCGSTKEGVISILGEYYFKRMKNHQMYKMIQSGPRKGHKEPQAYGYNLQDDGFWDKCWLFKKDTVGSYGLYPFQIKGYNYKGEACTQQCAEPFNPPHINYPEEILIMYNSD